MPDTPLGRELASAVPDPPVVLDATGILSRARRRRTLRTSAVSVSASVAVVALAILVADVHPGAGHVGPVITKAPSPAPSPAPSASPTAPTAPDVIGLPVDAAMTAMQRAGCGADVGAIANGAAPVGAVLAQRRTSDLCEVALTVSAGPRSSAPPCTSMTVTAGVGGAGLGHYGFPLHFRNTGGTACSLNGYPTVTARDSSSGRQVAARHTPNGYLGGTTVPVPTLYLAPGDQVSALVEGTDNPLGNATSCSDLTHLRVTVNGRVTSVGQTLSNCSGMDVHPYVPGTTGSAQ